MAEDTIRESKPAGRNMSRRDFLKIMGGAGAGVVGGVLEPLAREPKDAKAKAAEQPENEKPVSHEEASSEIGVLTDMVLDLNSDHGEARVELVRELAKPVLIESLIDSGSFSEFTIKGYDANNANGSKPVVLSIISPSSSDYNSSAFPFGMEDEDPGIRIRQLSSAKEVKESSSNVFVEMSGEPPGVWADLLSGLEKTEVPHAITQEVVNRYVVNRSELGAMITKADEASSSGEVLGIDISSAEVWFAAHRRDIEISSSTEASELQRLLDPDIIPAVENSTFGSSELVEFTADHRLRAHPAFKFAHTHMLYILRPGSSRRYTTLNLVTGSRNLTFNVDNSVARGILLDDNQGPAICEYQDNSSSHLHADGIRAPYSAFAHSVTQTTLELMIEGEDHVFTTRV